MRKNLIIPSTGPEPIFYKYQQKNNRCCVKLRSITSSLYYFGWLPLVGLLEYVENCSMSMKPSDAFCVNPDDLVHLEHFHHPLCRNVPFITTKFKKDQFYILARHLVMRTNVENDLLQAFQSDASRIFLSDSGSFHKILLESSRKFLGVMLLTVQFQCLTEAIKGQRRVGR
jgi:hypothetical protein